MILERQVSAEDDGRRADVVVAGWLGEPRARAQERLSAGQVIVEGQQAAKSRRLRAGEHVAVAAPPPAGPVAAPPPVPLRHDDPDLCVVAKPAGLVVHAGSSVRSPTLVDALQAMGVPLADTGDADRPGIVHRLDRGTSGLLVVAKTHAAAEGLRWLFRRHEVDRRYWALVEGVPQPPSATIDAPIARSVAHRHRFAVDAGGRHAVSHYDVEEAVGNAAVVRVRLETGRTHQVRVHLAAVGHPVCGDRVYGAARFAGLDRPALHAERLSFAHPVTGARVDVTEPLPQDLVTALASLR